MPELSEGLVDSELMEVIEPFRGKSRRVLADIPRTIGPDELYDALVRAPGWDYKDPDTADIYLTRDRALLALLYMGALRISEALRLLRSQFVHDPKRKMWVIRGVKLSKEQTTRHLKDGRVVTRPRLHSYREEVWLPLTGPRKAFTQLVLDWVEPIQEGRIFGKQLGTQGFATNQRATQIMGATLGLWLHYLRAQGERYLYKAWKKDLHATASYLRIDEGTLAKYLGQQVEGVKPV